MFPVRPAPTFVRGYLRGYARLLGVPVGPVLEAYDREGFRPPDLVADISEEPENAASDFPVRLVTWAVVLVLLAMVVVWWNNNNPELSDLLAPVASDNASSREPQNRAFTSSSRHSLDARSMQNSNIATPVKPLAAAIFQHASSVPGSTISDWRSELPRPKWVSRNRPC